MILYKRWDIVLVPFPFTDLTSIKKRPALIISPEKYNSYGDLIIAYITSNIPYEFKYGDYLIQNWEKSSLPKPSVFRMKFATIDSSIIVKKIGKLYEPDLNEFRKELLIFLQ